MAAPRATQQHAALLRRRKPGFEVMQRSHCNSRETCAHCAPALVSKRDTATERGCQLAHTVQLHRCAMRRSDVQMRLHSGMTLTELVVVIAIVGILFGIGAPSYRYVTNSNRMSSEVNALLGDMQYTRSQALREGRRVVICISSNGTSCVGGTTNTWQSGWIVFS